MTGVAWDRNFNQTVSLLGDMLELEWLVLMHLHSLRVGIAHDVPRCSHRASPLILRSRSHPECEVDTNALEGYDCTQDQTPRCYREFREGHFTVQKTQKLFSSIPIDQVHEKNNFSINEMVEQLVSLTILVPYVFGWLRDQNLRADGRIRGLAPALQTSNSRILHLDTNSFITRKDITRRFWHGGHLEIQYARHNERISISQMKSEMSATYSCTSVPKLVLDS